MNTVADQGNGRFSWFFSGGIVGILIALVVAVLLIVGLVVGWNRWGPAVIAGDAYQLQTDCIELTPQPAWIQSDVKREVMVEGSLEGMPLLDRQLTVNVARAFELHSWVERVERVRKRPGPKVQVELIYRRPVAMVEVLTEDQPGLLPVDRFGVVLPPADFSAEQARDYLRVVVDYHQPNGPLGTSWGDDRVEGAAMASMLNEIKWQDAGLYRVVAISQPSNPTRSNFRYDLVTRNQQRIRWGRAPGSELQDEPGAADKITRLLEYVRQDGGLKGDQDSRVIDLRQPLAPRVSSANASTPH